MRTKLTVLLIAAALAMIIVAVTKHHAFPWDMTMIGPFALALYLLFWLLIIYSRKGLEVNKKEEVLALMVLGFCGSCFFDFFALSGAQIILSSLFSFALVFLYWEINLHIIDQRSVWNQQL